MEAWILLKGDDQKFLSHELIRVFNSWLCKMFVTTIADTIAMFEA